MKSRRQLPEVNGSVHQETTHFRYLGERSLDNVSHGLGVLWSEVGIGTAVDNSTEDTESKSLSC
jgi:hypothetical protein